MTVSTVSASVSERICRLRIVGCATPAAAIEQDDELEISIDLKRAFHQGYIDWHRKPPAVGTNPLFQEYINLLADSPYLIWESGGFAADRDGRSGESHKLGRCLSRAYLEQPCGFTWFTHLSNLKGAGVEGWKVEKKEKGDQPDWLIADGDTAAVAEAKGLGGSISPTRIEKWRKQVVNVRVFKEDIEKQLPTYIVANRWVTVDQKKLKPEMYVEDPPTDGALLTDDDRPGLSAWIMRNHVIQNLIRLGLGGTAAELAVDRKWRGEPTPVLIWESTLPGLSGQRFVGRLVPPPNGFPCAELWALINHQWSELSGERLHAEDVIWKALRHHRLNGGYFDGLSIDTIRHARAGKAFVGSAVNDFGQLPPDASLLTDGSLIAPAHSMRPVDFVAV